MVAAVVEISRTAPPPVSFPKIHPNFGAQASLTLNVKVDVYG